MVQSPPKNASEIKTQRQQYTKLRARNLAEELGISEAQLVAADIGDGVTAIAPHPDQLIAHIMNLGDVMGLTRNESCVIEKVGTYENFRPGSHVSMVINKQIDMRFFPNHWKFAFAVEQETDKGIKRSVQVFDAAGDAVHKIYMRPESNIKEWDIMVKALRLEGQNADIEVAQRKPTDGPRGDVTKVEELRAEWDKMTDTHQFIRFVHKMKMNRLGAYRMIGEPYVRPLENSAVEELITKLAGTGIDSFTFIGNLGCIQIHHGVIENVKQVGPWFNILDSGYDMHLRADHITEVLAVTKSTRDGPTTSIEAFDSEGMIILQIFGSRRSSEGNLDKFHKIINALPTREKSVAAAE